jgi:hypothetical protein
MEFVFICAVIGCIPAAIAHSKGQNFFVWWLYGALLFIVALIHSLMLKPEVMPVPKPTESDAADELAKFAKLKDQGAITDEEFQVQKTRIMEKLTPSIVTGR